MKKTLKRYSWKLYLYTVNTLFLLLGGLAFLSVLGVIWSPEKTVFAQLIATDILSFFFLFVITGIIED